MEENTTQLKRLLNSSHLVLLVFTTAVLIVVNRVNSYKQKEQLDFLIQLNSVDKEMKKFGLNSIKEKYRNKLGKINEEITNNRIKKNIVNIFFNV